MERRAEWFEEGERCNQGGVVAIFQCRREIGMKVGGENGLHQR
jgi:hypothetical protein